MLLHLLLLFLSTPQELARVDRAAPLTVEGALKRAMAQNRTLKEVGYRIKGAKLGKSAAKGKFKPTIVSSVTGMSAKSDPVPGSFFSVTKLSKYRFEAGVQRLLETGGAISLTFNGERNEQTMEIQGMGVIDTTSYNSGLTLALSHPLLAGFGIAVTRVEIDKASLNVELEELNLKAKAEGVVRDLVTAYWDLQLAWNNYRMLQMGLKVSQSQLQLTKALLEGDRATESDLLAVKTAVAQRKGELLQSASGILAATTALKRLMGEPLNKPPYLYRPTSQVAPYLRRGLPKALFKLAVARSKDLAVLEKRIQVLHKDLMVAEEKQKPQLDLTLGVGPTSASKSLSDTLSRLVQFKAFTLSAGLSFQYSLGAIHAQKVSAALIKNTVASLGLAKANLRAALNQGALLALNAYQVAKKRIAIAELTIQSAQLHLEKEKTLFRAGRGTNHSVLLRLETLERARLSRLLAQRDLIVAQTQILALSGGILSAYGLNLP